MIPVIWLSFDDTPARCRWDQDIVDVICPPPVFAHFANFGEFFGYFHQEPNVPTDGAVVVFPAGENAKHLPALNRFIESFSWVVLILTSDEQSTFPWHNVHHPNMRMWVQYPRPDKHKGQHIRYLPIGCPARADLTMTDKNIDVFFSGQVTHLQRELMVESFQHSELDYVIRPSPGFTQGLERAEYLSMMARAKVALSPSGPTSADSFRTWEALEYGAVPIVDQGPRPDDEGRAIAGYPRGFWDLLAGYHPPFPVVDDWKQAPGLAQAIVDEYPVVNNECSSWWQRKKRDMRRRLMDDICDLGGQYVGPPGSNITVLVPTSPTPNNPDADHLIATIFSIHSRLPNSEILLMMDGVRHEQQAERGPNYQEYCRRVLWMCNTVDYITPFYYPDHLHQAEMTRRTLEHVDTDFVLFVEHDTPLVGDIPWSEWVDHLMDGQDVIRTYHESVMQPEHKYLMEEQYGDYTTTHQWSQRPHLARTSWYRKTLGFFFDTGEKGMIEDRLHSYAQSQPDLFRILLYTPSGNIQRAGHLDARGDDPKWTEG